MPIREKLLQQLQKFRRRLHSIAELSGKERDTALAIKKWLKNTEPDELRSEIGGTGILATYRGEKPGPHILIRCELDALPIQESNNMEYKSQSAGVAHKCGHDGHMAIVCGVASWLKNNRPDCGKVSLLFQPAEETGEGAQKVLQDHKFNELSPDYYFALHNLPGYPKHQIIVREGVFAAASVGMIIRLSGKTAHAAHPEEGISPAMALAQLIQTFSAVPQFYSSLEESVKVTVIHAEMGERAFGTSPAEATLMTTLRTYNDRTLDRLKDKCQQLAERTAENFGLDISCEWVEAFPATVNDSDSVAIIRKVAKRKALNIKEKSSPFSWSEDFGHFIATKKGAMFGLGAGESQAPLHAEDYDFPDEIISTGIEMFTGIIEELNGKE